MNTKKKIMKNDAKSKKQKTKRTTFVGIKTLVILFIITFIGGYLRFVDLGQNGFWVDEAWFGFLVKSGGNQEFIPKWFCQIFGLKSEFELRFFSALCGTLTIPAAYFVIKQNKLAFSLLIAVFPLFVFWSRMARPYASAGLFVVLGWRWFVFYIPAILTTPISLIGVRIIKQKWYVTLIATFAAIFFYLIRQDVGRNWTFEQILNSSRWFYVPILTIMLYCFDYFLPLAKPKLVQKRGKVQ